MSVGLALSLIAGVPFLCALALAEADAPVWKVFLGASGSVASVYAGLLAWTRFRVLPPAANADVVVVRSFPHDAAREPITLAATAIGIVIIAAALALLITRLAGGRDHGPAT